MFTAISIIVIVGIIAFVAVFIAVLVAIFKITNSVRQTSQAILGTANVVKGLTDLKKTTDYEMQTREKSVSAMTSVYLPKIKKDFPDFNYDEMKSRSQSVLYSYLKTFDAEDATLLEDVTPEFKSRISNQISMNKGDRVHMHFKSPKIHRTEIMNYVQKDGRCIITFQTSIQYIYYKMRGDKLIDGSKDNMTQSRYNIDCIYIQDRDKVEATLDEGLAFNCPNCGAPIKGLGSKTCAYCGSPVIEYNLKTWSFSDVVRSSST